MHNYTQICGQEKCLSGHCNCSKPQVTQWTSRLVRCEPGPVRAPCCWGLKDAHVHVCHFCAHWVPEVAHGSLFFFVAQRNTWSHDASEPSGTAHTAAAPRSGPMKSTGGVGWCRLLFLLLFQLKRRKRVALPTSLTDSEAFSHCHTLEFIPFFSMDYSHLPKCLRATRAQCPSFIAKNACKNFGAGHHTMAMS